MKFNIFFKNLLILSFCLVGTHLLGQNGIIRGKIIDKASGETVIGATIEVSQDGVPVTGTASDLDGNYFLELTAGTYDVSIHYLSYMAIKIADIALDPREVYPLDIALESETISLNEIIIKADAVRSSEVALIALQRQASGIQDGVSAQQITRTGSSNAADAIKQMPGAVVEDGKYIVMRGLGDRYSISQLNGITLPGTDPYRNSTSLDLIPSQIIDHIISVKTFSPDMPGNFSGGLINIFTKNIPDRFELSMSVSGSHNSQSSLINNFQKDGNTGKLDWLGFNDGSRDQPTLLLDPAVRDQLSSSTYLKVRQNGNDEMRNIFHESSHSLSHSFFPVSHNTPLNMGFNLAVGHRFPVFKKDFGFTVSLNYGSNYQHYDDGVVATYINTNTDFLFPYQKLQESKSVYNPTLGGLFNFAYKLSDHHMLSGNVVFNNDAEIISRTQSGEFLGQVSNSNASFETSSFEFIQRQIINNQLRGKHVFPTLNGIQIEWHGSMMNSFQDEPDLRYFAYTKDCDDSNGENPCSYYINNAEFAFPYHFFRKLEDKGYEGKADITIPLGSNGSENSNALKIGGLFTTTERDFKEYRYQLNNSGVPAELNFTSFNGNFNDFLSPSNFGIIDTLFNTDGSVQRYVTGYHYINQINSRNFYKGSSTIGAAYAMLTFNITRDLKTVGGLRVEKTDMEVVSEDPSVPKGTINQTDLLPSLNLIYAVNEKTNIRIGGSQTLARPNMRELAPFVQFDTKNGFFNVGNPGLKRTLIQNYDIRYEVFPDHGELLAISGFYKAFTDPIIRAFNPKATIPELSFINVDKAFVFGAELELRKELDFISPALKYIYLSTNVAFIYSRYKVPGDEIDNSKNIDPEYDVTHRPFQGQAPFIINTTLSYVNPDFGLDMALSFNISDKKLHHISLFATPDVYEDPFSLLNFKISKRFAEFYQVSFTAKNILNDTYLKTHEFHGEKYTAESFSIGRTLGVSLTYHLK